MTPEEAVLDAELHRALESYVERDRRWRERWAGHLPRFCAQALKIRPEDGELQPFVLNAVQQELHADLENIKAETGRVRVIILKARQMGVSTYTAARFYHRMRHSDGFRSMIMTHRDDATRNLAEMVSRFHDHDPDHPPHRMKNSSSLILLNGSGVSISTAGSVVTGAGRSFTFQLAHLSETAFWSQAAEHMNAVMRSIPDRDGTECIIESTANGAMGVFYTMALAAMAEQGDFKLLFYPWFLHEAYARAPPPGWRPGPAVLELAGHGLTAEQLFWAERKNEEIASYDGDDPGELCWRFKQEYPSTVIEAFRAARTGGFIPPSIVGEARLRQNITQRDMPLILGCDFATGGGGSESEYLSAAHGDAGGEDGDMNVFIDRQGRTAGRVLYDRFRDRSTLSVANRLQRHLEKLGPDRVFMDRGGGGAAVFDILHDRGFGRQLELVDFGRAARAVDQRRYRNKRAEMFGDLREWLQDADIPDDDLLESEITAPWVKQEDEQGLLLAPKREIRQKLHMSPDGADALAMTFAAPVRRASGRLGFHAGNLR